MDNKDVFHIVVNKNITANAVNQTSTQRLADAIAAIDKRITLISAVRIIIGVL